MINPYQEFKFDIHNISDSPNSYSATLKVSSELTYFDGHFPGQPVLPAVAIIDASLETLKAAFGVQARLVKVKSSKFTAPITPGSEITIKSQQDDPYRWLIKWYLNDKVVADLDLDIATDLSLGC